MEYTLKVVLAELEDCVRRSEQLDVQFRIKCEELEAIQREQNQITQQLDSIRSTIEHLVYAQ